MNINRETHIFEIIKSWPVSLQLIVIGFILIQAISIPANLSSLYTAPNVQTIKQQSDSLIVQVDSFRVKLLTVQGELSNLSHRFDSAVVQQNRVGDQVDFLWCVSERGETPEVRRLCAEIREAARRELQRRALER